MFGRFTERAQKVLALAQEEAIGWAIITLEQSIFCSGLIREGEGIAAKALHALGLVPKKFKGEVEH